MVGVVSLQVQGVCPACGGRSLFIGEGGWITCSRLDCPEPDAVSTILNDDEIQHIVEFKDQTFTIRHPLCERIEDRLMECELFDFLRTLPGPPVRPGRYRARPVGGLREWAWETLT